MRKMVTLMILVIIFWTPVLVSAEDDIYVQHLPEYMPQAPNAQAIARAIDIPVDYYTGLPNISIPLYNIQVGSLSVPITLSYQGGGIRPSQEATCVGLGWNLNVGGVITRTVKCADDFMETNVPGTQYDYGFLEKQEWPDLSSEFDYNYYNLVANLHYSSSAGYYNVWDAYLKVDSEPDIFFYSFPGSSGKFSFKKGGAIVHFDKSTNVEITPSYGASPRPFFYILDSNGTTYSFETKERTMSYSSEGGYNVNTTSSGVDIIYPAGQQYFPLVADYTSSWYLTQMISTTNDTINFIYENEDFGLPLQESQHFIKRINGYCINQDADGIETTASKTEVEGKRLAGITWRGGRVDFEYGSTRQDLICTTSDTPRPLTNIKVYDINNTLICHWKMTYDYFNKNLTGIPSNRMHLFKRLRLNSVKNMLADQDPYGFCYYDSVPMPVKNTKNVDYWGYYNGINQGENYYCPAYDGYINSKKMPNARYSKIGVLESIVHPTGGITKFHWESNKTGEAIVMGNSLQDSDFDSYTRGYLVTGRGDNISYERVRKKTVLISRETEIYLLFYSAYVGSQTCPSFGGTAFTIDKIHENGIHTQCYSWSATTVGNEFQQTVVLNPGIYEFKCNAVVDDVEYRMLFIDSKNKYSLKREYEGIMYSCSSTMVSGFPASDSKIITLEHGGEVFFSYFNETVTSGVTTEYTQLKPFRILKRNGNGSFVEVSHWTISGYNLDENKTVYLDEGTYKIECNAVVDDVAFSLSYSFGTVNYCPINIHNYEWKWNGNVLITYKEGNVGNENNLALCEADTITINNPAKMYLDWFYEIKGDAVDTLDLINTRPFSIYKQDVYGNFNMLYSIPASSFADFNDIDQEASGLFLESGTYIIRCEATTEDVVFCSEYVYKFDDLYSDVGSRRGGLRIGRIEGEKDVTYLYEGGKDMIHPCTYYKDKRVFRDENETSWEVTYEVRPSESVRPLSSLKTGNSIGYSKVMEIYEDNSRTEYTYHNEEEELVDPDFPYSPSYTDWKNGIMLTKTDFDANGDSISHRFNSYIFRETEPLYLAGFIELRLGNDLYYYNNVICPKLSRTICTEYRSNGKIVTSQSFGYNDNLVCNEETSQVGSDISKTIYKYPDDFSDNVSQLMVQRNMIGVPVAQLTARNGIFYCGARTLYGNYNELTDNGNTAICGTRTWSETEFGQMYLPKYLLTLNTATAASDFSSCQFDTTIVFNSYTRFGKARELLYKGMPITYLWAYQGMYPVAEIKNATYQQFMTQYGGASFDMINTIYQDPEFLRDRIWMACENLDNASVNIALYKPLVGASEMTNERGVMHSCRYDAAGRLTSVYQESVFASLYELTRTFSYGNNYVNSSIYYSTSNQSAVQSIQYYDAWGRPSVFATQGLKQDGTFSYSMQTYDSRSRPYKNYVQVPSSNTVGSDMSEDYFINLSATTFSGDS